jgi:hypothetical protein
MGIWFKGYRIEVHTETDVRVALLYLAHLDAA